MLARVLQLGPRDQALRLRREPVEHGIGGVERGPFQIDRGQTPVGPIRSGLAAHLLHQLPFEQPFDAAGLPMHRQTRVVIGVPNRGDVGKRLPPHRHDVAGGTVGPRRFAGGIRPVYARGGGVDEAAQRHLHLPCGGRAAVLQRQFGVQGQVVRHRMHGRHRVRQGHGFHHPVEVEAGLTGVFEQEQQHAGGAEFQCLRHVHAVGVADDHMQPAVCVGAVRFVARIDDGPVEGGLQADLHVEIIGALAELESRLFAFLADADASGTGEDLPCDEMRRHQAGHPHERNGPQHHVVLMRAPTGAFAVDVVAMQYDSVAGLLARPFRGVAHDEVSGMVVKHRVERVGGLRRGIFGMRVVDVHTPAIARDHIGDVELRRIGKQVGMRGGALQSGAARIVDGILLTVVPTNVPGILIGRRRDHVE